MPRILVLEPYLPLAQAIAKLLRRAGWDVTAGQMAREALQALAEEHYDVLVVDLESECNEGWRMLTTLQGRAVHLAIVALLSPDSRRRQEAQAWGVRTIVPPPIRGQALQTAVKAALTTAVNTQGSEHAR
jgi:CheY-like chemotaxis protein